MFTTIRKIEILDRNTKEEKSFDRETYQGDFDQLILKNLEESEIEYYAERHLNMIDEDDCTPCNCSTDDYTDEFLIEVLQERGHIFLKCDSITDTMKAKELKKLMASL